MKRLILMFLLFCLSISAQTARVYIGYIEGEIDPGLAPYIQRVLNEAEQNNADAVIFKVNTFGGRVDAATQIKDAILESNLKTIAFINNRAISAGALISLSCETIVMAPGSSIGAASVVDQTGEVLSEKYQSYMRGEMRSTAERRGRRTDIAEGMVDPRIVVDGLVDSTRLITLTTEEAKQFGIADTVLNNIDEIISALGFQNAEIITVGSNWAEEVVSFINNPVISSILIMIGFFGLLAEVKTPGWGVPGTIGLVALALFFGSSYILNMASALDIILFVAGLTLLAVEIFVIPGFGLAGIGGIILIFASLFLSLTPSGPFLDFNAIAIAIIQLAAALVFALILFYFAAKFLPGTTAFGQLILKQEEKTTEGFTSHPSASELVGQEGIALTTLRPAGTAEINGERYDVMADSEYIEKGDRIKVKKVEGIKILVRKIT
ncbi:MAG: NfeD family protein [Ignavibacteriaceae bacterium]